MTKCSKIPLLIFQNNINNLIIYLPALFTWKSNYYEYLYVGKLSKVKRLNYIFIIYGVGDASPDLAPNPHGFLKHPPSPPHYNNGSGKTRPIRDKAERVPTGRIQIGIPISAEISIIDATFYINYWRVLL